MSRSAGDASSKLRTSPESVVTWYRMGFESGALGWVRNDFIKLP
ncbi:MAG: hypothetical protein AAFP03_00100 [Cyanobacteria bacterium J06598_3]